MRAIRNLKGNYTKNCLEGIASVIDTCAGLSVAYAESKLFDESVKIDTRFYEYSEHAVDRKDLNYIRSIYVNTKQDLK